MAVGLPPPILSSVALFRAFLTFTLNFPNLQNRLKLADLVYIIDFEFILYVRSLESYSKVFVAENGSLTEIEKVSLSLSNLCLNPIPVKNINGRFDCKLMSPPKR